jgi:flagellar hook-length control protein FliK
VDDGALANGKGGNAGAAVNAAVQQGTAGAATVADALAANNLGGGDAQGSLAALKDTADAARATLAAAQAAATSGTAVQTANPNAASVAAAALAPPVGTSAWQDALSQKVVFLSNAHQQTAELTLNPPDLGPLQVVLQVAGNHAHALFVSQHPQVRDAVEAALPKLREAMASGGIGLGSTSVSDGFARQSGQQADGQSGRSAGRSAGSGGGGGESEVVVAGGAAVRRSVGLVDTFA